jgi:hypothetical protein
MPPKTYIAPRKLEHVAAERIYNKTSIKRNNGDTIECR